MSFLTLCSCSSPPRNVLPCEVGARPHDLGDRVNGCVQVFVGLSGNSLWPEHVVPMGRVVGGGDVKLGGGTHGKIRTMGGTHGKD